jgi:hypothetical protein
MTTYLITIRKNGAQAIHKPESAEEAACEIAHQLLRFRGNSEALMAIKSDSPLATFSLLKDDILCSLEVTQQSIKAWHSDIANIQSALNGFQEARDQAESILERALVDLDSAYNNSRDFNDYTPSDEISVYGALDEMGANDLNYSFNRAVRELYKFKVFDRQAA